MSKVTREQKDQLTGLPKKADFDEFLAAALQESGGEHPVSLALVDIDRFNDINEKHGHGRGDEVILGVAKAISQELEPEKPMLCRIGGDEFAVILTGLEKETAFLRLEQLRKAVAGLKGFMPMEPGPTVSIGLATYPHDGSTRQGVVRQVDDALFRAKAAGRNRVALAREEKMVPKASHFTQGQLERLELLSGKEGVGEAELLREALDDLLKKYQWSRPSGKPEEPHEPEEPGKPAKTAERPKDRRRRRIEGT